MNERIRIFMEGYFDITVDSHGREECTADYINVQKFADLIIMECADVGSYYGGNVKHLILSHFGVEE